MTEQELMDLTDKVHTEHGTRRRYADALFYLCHIKPELIDLVKALVNTDVGSEDADKIFSDLDPLVHDVWDENVDYYSLVA